jgi:hypothetical protein
MESITYAVQDCVQLTEQLDGLDTLPPMPTSIKDQMPGIASLLQQLSANMGREGIATTVKAAVDLRKAYDRDDYAGVSAVYARNVGWLTRFEAGYQLGVPDAHMVAFAKRHRSKR